MQVINYLWVTGIAVTIYRLGVDRSSLYNNSGCHLIYNKATQLDMLIMTTLTEDLMSIVVLDTHLFDCYGARSGRGQVLVTQSWQYIKNQ